MKSISMALLALGLFASSAVRAADPLPRGWMLGGKGYEAGLDQQTKHGGSASAFLRRNGGGDEFGTLMQMIDATAYRGVRLRLTGYSRAVEVAGWAGFWLRVDGPAGVLAFDNMQSRPIRGTKEWKRDEIVLDVPPEAKALAFGVLLAGGGQVWVDDLRLETVGQDVAVTAPGQTR